MEPVPLAHPTADPAPQRPDRIFFAFNAVVSATAVVFLSYLLLGPRLVVAGKGSLEFMPAVNAGLNALAATLLVSGYLAIRRKAISLHKYCMVGALAASAVFLAGYVLYHSVHGDTKFGGTGAIRVVYFSVLASHVLLSVTVLPLAMTTVYFVLSGRIGNHRKLARFTLPVWLYVSVTGVAIYFFLRR